MWCGVRQAATFDPHATFVSAAYVSRLVRAERLDLVRHVEKLRHVRHCGECAAGETVGTRVACVLGVAVG